MSKTGQHLDGNPGWPVRYSLPLLPCSVYSSSQLFQVSLFWGQLNETRPLFIPELVFWYDHIWALTAVQVHVLLGSAVWDRCLRSLLWGSLLRSGLGISFLEVMSIVYPLLCIFIYCYYCCLSVFIPNHKFYLVFPDSPPHLTGEEGWVSSCVVLVAGWG